MQKFDEMYAMLPFDGSDVREHYKRYGQWLARQPVDVMQARRAEAEMIFRRVGITFAVYGAKDEGGNTTIGEVRLSEATGNLIHADGIRVSIHGLDDLIVVANGREVMIMPRGSSQNVRNFAKD